MKTTTKFALTAFAVALLSTGSVFANGWYTIDNHHGYVFYVPTTEPAETTVGVVEKGRGVAKRETTTRPTERTERRDRTVRADRNNVRLRHVTTSQGATSYFAPAR